MQVVFLFLLISLLELKGAEMEFRSPTVPICLGLKGVLDARLSMLKQGHPGQTGRDGQPS